MAGFSRLWTRRFPGWKASGRIERLMNLIVPPKGIVAAIEDYFHVFAAMDGPSFLLVYVVWLLVLWLGVILLRACNYDTPLVSVTGLVLFEGGGVLRYFIGSAHGMHRWGFMIALMLVGAFF